LNYHIIQKGDENGNGMVVNFRLPSGLEIIGLPTKNFYGGHWDLGPTWNYVAMADEPFLVDAGRYGQGKNLLEMMKVAKIDPSDLNYVLISHSHEDHDGGLAELVRLTHLKVRAHAIYDLLIRQYPDIAPKGEKQQFPAKCWHCPMPETFFKENCLGYHKVLQGLQVDSIGDGANPLGPGIETRHLPGHSPDSLIVKIDSEAIIAGDVVLPDITPWPTRLELYDEVAELLSPHYPHPGKIFGLLRYIKSLKQLLKIADKNSGMVVFPAHRFYYQGQWQWIELHDRLEELLEHHVQRCGAILDILSHGDKTADEIAREHFEASLLEGFGSLMAANEIISHCELMMGSRDIVQTGDHRYAVSGTSNFEELIRSA
jgi:glyoxylase-like metal-dependent hydrolase (beta-lactamase superfamily II)